jgi:hypothetical protein
LKYWFKILDNSLICICNLLFCEKDCCISASYLVSKIFCPVLRSKTLKSFYDHLDDGGVLVFEAETKNAVPELGVWRGSKWLRPDGKMILLSSCASMDGDICSSVAKYELIDKNQVLQTEIEEYKIKIYEPGSLLELLKSIGFRNVKILKAFDRSNGPTDSDESVVYECRK